uniref:Mob1 family protein n=1 Tax=Coccidioides posadasii RMSCC 3488 TaxID=454284 RepID=A0A0J6FJL5_COCPO|nr:Mob1 family protein [Coccidioides posadasii RMSCC 3488]
MTALGASPSSSPRLPSPPPFTEVQIGPKSPTVSDSPLAASPAQDDASTRRIRPGTKAVDMASGPPLVPLSQLDSPFQLQEHLKASYQDYTRPPGSSTVIPINRATAEQLAEPPEGVERSLWLYELCRFLTMKANNIVIAFFAETPPCSVQTCPEMRASEWQYLCAVHDPPKACCAIDYCCHTLDWATNILTSPKFFPSRLTLGSEAGGGPQASMRHLTNIFRRVYRIFAHAWFQHREVFWQVEGHDGLHVFFKTVCDMYNLLPEDNYTIPAEAEGEEPRTSKPDEAGRKMTILRKEDKRQPELSLDSASSLGTGATTRRHRHSPSTGAAVSTIAEAAEDEDGSKTTGDTSALEPTEETEEETDVEQLDNLQNDTPSTPSEQSSETVATPGEDGITSLPEKLGQEEQTEMTDTSNKLSQPGVNADTEPTENGTLHEQPNRPAQEEIQAQEENEEQTQAPVAEPLKESEPDSKPESSPERPSDDLPAEAATKDQPSPDSNTENTTQDQPEEKNNTSAETEPEPESHSADEPRPPPEKTEEVGQVQNA